MHRGLALDRTEFCSLLTLRSAHSVYGIANLDPSPSRAAVGLKQLTALGLMTGTKASALLRLMSVVVSPRFIVVAQTPAGAASLHYLDPPICVSVEGGLQGFQVGQVSTIDLLARRVLRFDPLLVSTLEPFALSEAPRQAPGDQPGGEVLVLRGSADLARKATLVAQPAGQGLVVYRPEATRPQLRAEPLSAATLSTVLSIFIAWLSTK